MTETRKRRWAAIAADMRDHHQVGIQVPPPKSADASRHAQSPFVAWTDIILSAAYAEHKTRAAGHQISLQRGEFVAARAYWAKRWNWGEQAVRGFFARLARDGMIEFCNQPDNQPSNQTVTIAKVCNYEVFQSFGDEKQPARQPASNQRATSEQPHTTKNTNNTNTKTQNRTDDQTAIDRFSQFWKSYPRKEQKHEAAKVFAKLTAEEQQQAIQGAALYAEKVRRESIEPKFVKLPQGWLNGKRFLDLVNGASANAEPNPDQQRKIESIAVNLWASTRTWDYKLGPPPGEKGCRIDAALIAAAVNGGAH